MASFGELNFESSRAFADDEDEDVSEPETLFGFLETYIFFGSRNIRLCIT